MEGHSKVLPHFCVCILCAQMFHVYYIYFAGENRTIGYLQQVHGTHPAGVRAQVSVLAIMHVYIHARIFTVQSSRATCMLAVCVSCAWVDSCGDLAGLLQETNFLCLPSVKPHLLEDVQARDSDYFAKIK